MVKKAYIKVPRFYNYGKYYEKFSFSCNDCLSEYIKFIVGDGLTAENATDAIKKIIIELQAPKTYDFLRKYIASTFYQVTISKSSFNEMINNCRTLEFKKLTLGLIWHQ